LVVIFGGYFGLTREGRTLFVDTALSVGLGSTIDDAHVQPGSCSSYETSGRYRWSGYECDIDVLRPREGGGTERVPLRVDLTDPAMVASAGEAATLFGVVGIRWPIGVVAARWLQLAPLLLCAAFLGWLIHIARSLMREDRLLIEAAQKGTIVPVDLLYPDVIGAKSAEPRQAWRFSYLDQFGRRQFARAVPGGPLQVDGVVTAGVALLSRSGKAWLVLSSLWPLDLPPLEVAHIADAAEMQRRQFRGPLKPLAGEPLDPPGRLAAIEALLRSKSMNAAERAYVFAWRLVWEYPDAAAAERAMELRNEAAAKLGPRKAFSVMKSCRRSLAKPSPRR
jgi:hypothetical protein